MSRLTLAGWLAALVLLAPLGTQAADPPTPERASLELAVAAPAEGDTSCNDTKLCLKPPMPWTDKKTLPLANAALKAQLSDLQPGDHIRATVEFDASHNPTQIIRFDTILRPVPPFLRVLVWGAVLFGLIVLFKRCSGKWPSALMIGEDNRYSNSKTQMTFWFGAVATAYGTFMVLRGFEFGMAYFAGVGMPENLITLTGMSALSFGGAKVITQQKANAAPAGVNPKPPALEAHFADDLINSDTSQPDLGDIQMILVACAAVTIFLVSAFHATALLPMTLTTSLPDVDSTLLASFGIGQGAYLVKKAASDAGKG